MLLLGLFLLHFATSAEAISLGNLFGGEDEQAANVTSIDEYGTVVVKTMQALGALKAPPMPQSTITAGSANNNETAVPYGANSRALVRRDGLNSIYIAFQDVELTNATADWARNTTQVPFLRDASKLSVPSYSYPLILEYFVTC